MEKYVPTKEFALKHATVVYRDDRPNTKIVFGDKSVDGDLVTFYTFDSDIADNYTVGKWNGPQLSYPYIKTVREIAQDMYSVDAIERIRTDYVEQVVVYAEIPVTKKNRGWIFSGPYSYEFDESDEYEIHVTTKDEFESLSLSKGYQEE